jgi:translocator protein
VLYYFYMKLHIKDPQKLTISLLIPFVAGYIGSLFTATQIGDWYDTLVKPDFVPPNWTFGVVWSALYFLMGIALYMVWTTGKNKKDIKLAIIFFSVQLMNNILWSVIFFGFERPYAAFIQIIALWILILLTIVHFAKIRTFAAMLLVPYLIWVTFAAYLNYTIYVLN